jgi:uncharacterized protein YpmS
MKTMKRILLILLGLLIAIVVAFAAQLGTEPRTSRLFIDAYATIEENVRTTYHRIVRYIRSFF